MKMGKFGAWIPTNSLTKDQLIELARSLDALAYDTLWYPESTSYDSLSLGGFLLSHSERLVVASGIANISPRWPDTILSPHYMTIDLSWALAFRILLLLPVVAVTSTESRSPLCGLISKGWSRPKLIWRHRGGTSCWRHSDLKCWNSLGT